MMDSIRRFWLTLRLVGVIGKMVNSYSLAYLRRKYTTKFLAPPPMVDATGEADPKNVIVVGASFAGYQAARMLHKSLPPVYQLIVVEPHSHFHFTWLFPRFCVLEGHEKKAFIPYALRSQAAGDDDVEEGENKSFRWIQGRVTQLTQDTVTIKKISDEQEGIEEVLNYEYLLLATGSISKEQSIRTTGGLPSRVVDNDRDQGAQRMVDIQARIRDSRRLVVVGGGAAGVELATDAATRYSIKDHPERKIVLVHSRSMPMHRFGPRLQNAALEGLRNVGVEVILEDRVMGDVEDGMVTLMSGKKVECDFLVDCAGQKPASSLISTLAPHCLTTSGHVKIRPTLQLDDNKLSHIYSCGDVAETHNKTPNGGAASLQATIAADNIIASAWGKEPSNTYAAHWAESHIKLTLGLEDSILHFGDGSTELLFQKKDKPTLMAAEAWAKMGAKPFEELEIAKM